MLLRRTKSKMMKIIDCKIYVVLKDSTIFIGILKAFDHNFNLVLADSQTFLEHNILGPPALDESNRQKRLLGLIVIPAKNIISIDNKLGSNVPKVLITDIIICRLKDYRRDVRDPNRNIEDSQADIIFEKDLYHIPMVDPTAYIIRGRHRSLPLMALISEDCQQTMNNCLATNGLPVQDYLADIDQNEPFPSMPFMGIGKLITKLGMSQNGSPSMSGMTQNRPLMPYVGYNASPIRSGMSQNGPPSMSGMAQNRPLMPYVGYNASPIRSGMSQNGPPSMSGMAQNRPLMPYVGYNASRIRSGMSQNGPPSMSGMAQNRPTMPYMCKGKSSTINKYAN